MTTEPKLLPCPFCRSENLKLYNQTVPFVECKSCLGTGPIEVDADTAILSWNNRPSPPENASPKGSDRSVDAAEIPNTAAGVAGPSVMLQAHKDAQAAIMSVTAVLKSQGVCNTDDGIRAVELGAEILLALTDSGFKIVRAE